MLSWDEFDSEEVVREAAKETARNDVLNAAPVAPAPVQQIAQTEAPQATFAATSNAEGISPELAKARAALATLDPAPGIAELEMGAHRIQVDEKQMINCRADLNQLVPFKYDWAWQKYLDEADAPKKAKAREAYRKIELTPKEGCKDILRKFCFKMKLFEEWLELPDIKGDIEALLAPLKADFVPATHPAMHPGRCAQVLLGGKPIGYVGELHPKWRQGYELPQAPMLFELELESVLDRKMSEFAPVPKFQPVQRDIAVVCP